MAMGEFSTKRLSTHVGIEIGGLDLSSDLSDQTIADLYQILVNFGVLVFRDQNLSPRAQERLGRGFGDPVVPLKVYPGFEGAPVVSVLHADAQKPPDTNIWHVDSSFRRRPPFATLLSSVCVPSVGGDTIFACMRKALHSLPFEVKGMISDYFAVHEAGDLKNHFARSPYDHDALIEGLTENGAAIHPVVKIHPFTAEAALYVNETYTSHILNLNAGESRRILNYLFDFVKTPEFHYRHRWEEGMVVLWDNRLVQHYAVADYHPQTRTMHRLAIQNDLHAMNDHEVSL